VSGNILNELNQGVSASFSPCFETGGQRPPVIDPLKDFYKAAFGSPGRHLHLRYFVYNYLGQ